MQRNQNYFVQELIDWFSKAKRDLPWRQTRDPYKIWLSEIILQQTRVEQGLPYYERFIDHHPDVHSLADSNEKDVLKLWEGLGYYSRARNLHATAKFISKELNGTFPNNYQNLLQLKGIGPYTAAAIASIAFKESTPVVDGNVYRFASRYFGVFDDITQSATRKTFESLLRDIIPSDRPDDFNQAMMEFGATVCTPSPNCDQCHFTQSCFAYQQKAQNQLPVKTKKVKVSEEHLNYLIFEHSGKYLLHSRTEGIWKGLYQFYLIRSKEEQKELLNKYDGKVTMESEIIKHILTHRRLWVKFVTIEIHEAKSFKNLSKELGLHPFSLEEMLNLPRPKVIVNYLQQAVN
ncbi:A/G-specific adenine glycosylase [Marinoscillum sp. MHG1-6]|uniref:A/G-specific adenine glycosylase n=1 Tax=Marinoscillum sp. MHG1-6 TaxID=2959627 RepID=UPI0021583AFD|nr:A/G-specific adenine glycosylase [Marinoscillum sp. MHG1-6]